MTEKSVQRSITDQGPDSARLEYRQVGDMAAGTAFTRRIDCLALNEILNMTGADQEERARMTRSKIFWFANGFQSWSPGWELSFTARHPRLKLKRILEMYSLPEGPVPMGLKLAGHGIAYVREGETYAALVSVGRGTAPVTFELDRVRRRFSIQIASRGASFKDGEVLAQIVLVRKTGPFVFADALRDLFQGRTCMERAAFLGAPHIGGWVSWYSHYTRIDEPAIREDINGLATTGNLIRRGFIDRGLPVVFQVDDGWQVDVGDWQPNPRKFPSGMKALADAIRARGFIPGLWLAPFLVRPTSRLSKEKPEWLLAGPDGSPRLAGWNPNWGGDFFCLDLSRAEVRGHLRELLGTVIDAWGFRYIKLDFLYAGMLSGRNQQGGAAWRWYSEALEPVVSMTHSSSGQPVAFLGCGAPFESSVGLFPLMRVGADTRETWDSWLPMAIGHIARPSAYVNLKSTLGRWFMNRALYLSDPDVVFMRSTDCSLTESQKELVAAAAFMFSSQIMISDDVGRFGAPGEEKRTAHAMRLFDALNGRRYCALSIGRDLWRCFSEDGGVRGIANLRARPACVGGELAARWGLSGTPLTLRAHRRGSGLVMEAGSIALWRG